MPSSKIDTRHPAVRTWLWVVAGVGAAALIIGGIVLTTSIYELADATRSTQVANTERSNLDRQRDERTAETAADAARAAARIEDCTSPGRQCFEDAQKRLGRTVGTINRYALAAAYCADQVGEQTIDELQRCIIDQITAQNRQPQEPKQ